MTVNSEKSLKTEKKMIKIAYAGLPWETNWKRDHTEGKKNDFNNNYLKWIFDWNKATACPLLTGFKPVLFDSYETFSSTLLWFSKQPFFNYGNITQILLPYVERKPRESRLIVKAGRWASLISVGWPYAGLRSLRCAGVFACSVHTLFLFLFWHSASHHSSLPRPDKASQNIAPSRRLAAPSSTNSTRSDRSFR